MDAGWLKGRGGENMRSDGGDDVGVSELNGVVKELVVGWFTCFGSGDSGS